jgi:hypothetical protein
MRTFKKRVLFILLKLAICQRFLKILHVIVKNIPHNLPHLSLEVIEAARPYESIGSMAAAGRQKEDTSFGLLLTSAVLVVGGGSLAMFSERRPKVLRTAQGAWGAGLILAAAGGKLMRDGNSLVSGAGEIHKAERTRRVRISSAE